MRGLTPSKEDLIGVDKDLVDELMNTCETLKVLSTIRTETEQCSPHQGYVNRLLPWAGHLSEKKKEY